MSKQFLLFLAIVCLALLLVGCSDDDDVIMTDTGSVCGNGTVSGPEECDDMNMNNCDACHDDCTDNTGCGDGELCPPEVCDGAIVKSCV